MQTEILDSIVTKHNYKCCWFDNQSTFLKLQACCLRTITMIGYTWKPT